MKYFTLQRVMLWCTADYDELSAYKEQNSRLLHSFIKVWVLQKLIRYSLLQKLWK